jgi:hypothetical protein
VRRNEQKICFPSKTHRGQIESGIQLSEIEFNFKHENCYKFLFRIRRRQASKGLQLYFSYFIATVANQRLQSLRNKFRIFLELAPVKCLSLSNLKIIYFDNHKSAQVGIKLEFNWAFKMFAMPERRKQGQTGREIVFD